MKRFALTLVFLGIAISIAPLIAHLLGSDSLPFFFYPVFGITLFHAGLILLAAAWVAAAILTAGAKDAKPGTPREPGPRGVVIRAIAYPLGLLGVGLSIAHTATTNSGWSHLGERDRNDLLIGVLSIGDTLLYGAFLLVAASTIVDAIRSSAPPYRDN